MCMCMKGSWIAPVWTPGDFRPPTSSYHCSYILRNTPVLNTIDSQSSYSPVTSRLLPSFNEQWQADEVDGGSYSQRADVFQHESYQPRKAQDDLEQRGNQDGSLDLLMKRQEGQNWDTYTRILVVNYASYSITMVFPEASLNVSYLNKK